MPHTESSRGGQAPCRESGRPELRINTSRSPYFCSVDADSVLEQDALIKLMTPVIESSTPVVACGGVVRVLNGVRFKDDVQIGRHRPSRNALALFQIVEYIRSFLFGRVGFDALNSLMILSGTFSLFHKATIIEAGGFRPGTYRRTWK